MGVPDAVSVVGGLTGPQIDEVERVASRIADTVALSYRTYNVAAGRATTYAQIAAAIRKIIPDAKIDLPEGRDPNGPGHDTYLDITRIHQDTGYQPAYDTERAAADYISWLRAGNER